MRLVSEQLQTFEERLELQPSYVWSTGYFHHGPDGKSLQLRFGPYHVCLA